MPTQSDASCRAYATAPDTVPHEIGVCGALVTLVRARGRGLSPVLAAALLAGACASVQTGAPVAVATTAPWVLPPAEQGRQSLFRLQFSGERGDGALRAALRLDSAHRYQIAATDPVGRQLWSLSVAPEGARWLDHRGRRVCRVGAEIAIPDLGLPPLPLAAVPALLLGRLPLVPSAALPRTPGLENAPSGELRDGDRRWSWQRTGEQLSAWTLYQNGTPVLWWRRDGDGGTLSARRQGVQLRWQRVFTEPLASPPEPPATPGDYRSDECDGITLP
jgi:hypothetical protein